MTLTSWVCRTLLSGMKRILFEKRLTPEHGLHEMRPLSAIMPK